VEGARLRTARNDETKHRVHVLENVLRSHAEDTETFAREDCIASSVAPLLIAERVTLTVNLDDHASIETGEVHRHLADRKLAPEFQAVRPLPKLLPQKHFRQAQLSPQLTRAPYLLDWRLEDAWAPSTTQLR